MCPVQPSALATEGSYSTEICDPFGIVRPVSPNCAIYLSAIRHMQIVSGMSDPALASYARLNYALRGLRRVGGDGRRRARLPITPDILMKIYRQWSHVAQTYDHIMLWAAFCLGFFGFMHSGEFACPSWRDFKVDMLSPQDVSVHSHISPSYITVIIRRSKNDPFSCWCEAASGQNGASALSSFGIVVLLGHSAFATGPSFPLQGWLYIVQAKAGYLFA